VTGLDLCGVQEEKRVRELTSGGVCTVEKAGLLLEKLVPDIQSNAELVREIAAASSEQSTGSSQVNRAIQQLDQVIQQNAAAAEEMASTAHELASQAEALRTSIGFFRLGTQLRREAAKGVVPTLAELGRSKVADTKDLEFTSYES